MRTVPLDGRRTSPATSRYRSTSHSDYAVKTFFQWEKHLRLNLLNNGIPVKQALYGTLTDQQRNADVLTIITRGLEPELAFRFREDDSITPQILFAKLKAQFATVFLEFELKRLAANIAVPKLSKSFMETWMALLNDRDDQKKLLPTAATLADEDLMRALLTSISDDPEVHETMRHIASLNKHVTTLDIADVLKQMYRVEVEKRDKETLTLLAKTRCAKYGRTNHPTEECRDDQLRKRRQNKGRSQHSAVAGSGASRHFVADDLQMNDPVKMDRITVMTASGTLEGDSVGSL
ncbi:hypothetical protein BROUX41_006181 [Berkeleyomyces rouxiae]|uniref:uncharacterized protein n=1 Tax=Berkeleyomyces rouxiae TaxID=2035830 RepID=UPI003B76FB8E